MYYYDTETTDRAVAWYFADWPDGPQPNRSLTGEEEIEGQHYVVIANVIGPIAVCRVVGESFEQVDPEEYCGFNPDNPVYRHLIEIGLVEAPECEGA